MNNKRVAKGFDLLAPLYEFLLFITIGRGIKRSQIAHFHMLNSAKIILVFGGGSGWILKQVFAFSSPDRVVYVDISPKMLREAKKIKIPKGIEVEFVEGSFNSIGEYSFDTVITPFVLDCFSEKKLEEVVSVISKRLQINGLWLFSDFHKSKNVFNNTIIRVLYFLFQIVCGLSVSQLPDFEKVFSKTNLIKKGELYSSNKLFVSRSYIKRLPV